MKKKAVILFTRIPTAGHTKTRLQPFLDGQECCELHKAFIADMYSVLREIEADMIVSYDPDGDVGILQQLIQGNVRWSPQVGDNLGERMHRALAEALCSYECCLLIGSDIPLIQPCDIREAFMILANQDIVLAPTEDGGYYMVGMKQPCRTIFDMAYGLPTVMLNTVKAMEAAGKSWGLGSRLLDIDEKDDLLKLAKILETEPAYTCTETRRVLAQLIDGNGRRAIT